MSDFDTIRRKAWDEWWREAWWEQPRLITAFNAGYNAAVGRVEAELAVERERADTAESDRRMALFVLGELRFTLSQAKGYIRTVSEKRGDGGGSIVADLAERLSEVDALRERLRAALAGDVPPQDREPWESVPTRSPERPAIASKARQATSTPPLEVQLEAALAACNDYYDEVNLLGAVRDAASLPDGVGHWNRGSAHWFDPSSAPMTDCPLCVALAAALAGVSPWEGETL